MITRKSLFFLILTPNLLVSMQSQLPKLEELSVKALAALAQQEPYLRAYKNNPEALPLKLLPIELQQNINNAISIKVLKPKEQLMGHEEWVKSANFNQDCTKIVSVCDKTIKIWDALSGECLKTFINHPNSTRLVNFNSDSTQIALALERTIQIWDALSGKCLKILSDNDDFFSINSVNFNHDGTKIISAIKDLDVIRKPKIKIWDILTGTCREMILAGHTAEVNQAKFNHNGTKIISISWDQTIRLWNALTGECLAILSGHDAPVTLVQFSHDDTKIVTASWDNTAKVWDTITRECLTTFKGHNDIIISLSFNRLSTQVVSISEDGTLKRWDALTEKCLETMEISTYGGKIVIANLNHDHTQLFTIGSHGDPNIGMWQLPSNLDDKLKLLSSYLPDLSGVGLIELLNSLSFSTEEQKKDLCQFLEKYSKGSYLNTHFEWPIIDQKA